MSPCNCAGTTAFVHEECLVKWLNISGRTDCEICKYEYEFEEIEEIKYRACPDWYCGGRGSVSWFLFFMIGVPCLGFWGDFDTKSTFFTANLIMWWLILLVFKEDPGWKENSVLWKIGLCMGELVVAYHNEDWFFFELDMVLLCIRIFAVYLFLVSSQAKQVVRYIYTREYS